MENLVRPGRDQAVKRATLCSLDDIPDGGSNGFVAAMPSGERKAFLAVRKGKRAFVYINSCPHTGAPLDFHPGQFLNLDKTLIMCSTHGALFRIEDGFCLSGPCAAKSLEPVLTEVKDGRVYLVE
jgi:nitrite reductase/ring-hydroxylating ferredoxin subunit